MTKTESTLLSMLLNSCSDAKAPFAGPRDTKAALKLVNTIDCIALERGNLVWKLVIKNRSWDDVEHWQEQARFIAELTRVK